MDCLNQLGGNEIGFDCLFEESWCVVQVGLCKCV